MLVANSLFLGNYLTFQGQSASQDWAMLEDLGLEGKNLVCSTQGGK
jgi:biotin synthase-like enzyme